MKSVILIIYMAVQLPQVAAQQQDSGYMFSYFKNDGKDGLHLAWSSDGYNWKPLRNDSSFLHPAVATDKLMRDPCIIRGADNLFHMVWTVSWNDNGIGYANSPDLVHWSRQQFIPVMAVHDRHKLIMITNETA